MKCIELLAPAKNLECGIAAIDSGADAVYIGADRLGARQNASNSLEDIQHLCEYAHKFKACVYVAFNTIIYENELDYAQQMLTNLYNIGVDAVIVQDISLLNLGVPTPVFHASTQMDNRNIEHIKWLKSIGFSRVVVARELSLTEIANINKAVPDIEIECFVHGALCVSYSGVCYASQHCFNRSANRGECAQFCRMKFNLEDSNGTIIKENSHLLSLKDMSRINSIDKLIEAGVMSFKIEGRLKDVAYVRNVTAAYSQKINTFIQQNPNNYIRKSLGKIKYSFIPNINKTFNRGFTNYFLYGKNINISSFNTPKHVGECIGEVKTIVSSKCIILSTTHKINNGDGLCYFNSQGVLQGFRVNKAENNKIFLTQSIDELEKKMPIYRNFDISFDRQLSSICSERKIEIAIEYSFNNDEISVKCHVVEAENIKIEVKEHFKEQKANKNQRENIVKQLLKLGDTHYVCKDVIVKEEDEFKFIPSSLLSQIKKNIVVELTNKIVKEHDIERKLCIANNKPKVDATISQNRYEKQAYMHNISNSVAREIYNNCGLTHIDEAFELNAPKGEKILMQCKHCILYSLGCCKKENKKAQEWEEPLYLTLANKQRFQLKFNCNKCEMYVVAE